MSPDQSEIFSFFWIWNISWLDVQKECLSDYNIVHSEIEQNIKDTLAKYKVIIDKSCGEVSLVEQDTIEYVS